MEKGGSEVYVVAVIKLATREKKVFTDNKLFGHNKINSNLKA